MHRPNVHTSKIIEKVMELRSEGLSSAEIGRRVNRSRSAVALYLKKAQREADRAAFANAKITLATRLDAPEWLARVSIRTGHCLVNDMSEDFQTVGDLVKVEEATLLRIPNFGRKSLNELKSVLSTNVKLV